MTNAKTMITIAGFGFLFVFPLYGSASNGLNLIGFGVESIGMGGADLAVARDTSALNTNPAGLTQISAKQLDLQAARAFAVNVRHKDGFANDVEAVNDPMFANFGFAQRLQNRPITVGLGFFAQGGAGNEYPRVNTAFGTQDELTSLFRIGKLTGGAALAISDSLSVGAALAGTYSDISQCVFPNTSVFNPTSPESSFFGHQLEDVNGISYGMKLGVMYRVNPRLTWAVTYTSEVDLELEGDKFITDLSDMGLGKVRYRDVEIDGLKLPQELGLGFALRLRPKWLLALEISWLDWSDAIDTSTLTASNPDNPSAPATIELLSVDNWRDQYVFAVGFVYEANARMIIRAGYNFGRNPIPEDRTNPLLAAITEHHITFGLGYHLKKHWQLDFAIEYDINNSVTYTNPRLPFGPDAEEELEFYALHFNASRRW